MSEKLIAMAAEGKGLQDITDAIWYTLNGPAKAETVAWRAQAIGALIKGP